MQNQNFEDSVRKKMNELSLTPSEPVWLTVEAQIRKRKKRRVILFWLLPFLLAGGAAFLWLSNNNEIQQPFTATSSEAQSKTRLTTASTGKADRPMPVTIPAGTSSPKLTAGNSHPKKIVETNSPTPDRPITSIEKINDQVTTSESENSAPISLAQGPPFPLLDDTSLTMGETAITAANSGKKETPITQPDIPTTDSASPAIPEVKRGKKWQLLFHAQMGVSGSKEAALHSGTATANFPSGASPNQNRAYHNGVPAQKSVAYAVGVAAHRRISQRLTFTGGLQYSFFSTRTVAGQKVNNDTAILRNGDLTSVDFYYREGNTNRFHNRYHFLELPIGVSWQALPSKPLYLQGGISLARLVSTKALVYDRQANIYYDAGKALQPTQVHLSFGALYSVSFKKKYGFSLGPSLQYGLSPLYKEGSFARLSAVGIKTQFLLK